MGIVAYVSVMTHGGQIEIKVDSEKKRIETAAFLRGMGFEEEGIQANLPPSLFSHPDNLEAPNLEL